MEGTTPSIPYKIVQLANGDWCGFATVQTPYGTTTVKAVASPNEEAKRIIALLKQGGASAGFLGKLFKKIAKTVTSPIRAAYALAKNVAKGKILKGLKQAAGVVLRNPITKMALKVVNKVPFVKQALMAASVPFLGPFGPMLVPAALRMAGGLMGSARRGNPAARRRVQQVVAAARRGNPRARRMAAQLMRANQLMQRSPSFFDQAARQARQVAQQRRQPQYRQQQYGRYPASRYYGRARGDHAAISGSNGNWVDTEAGQVFVPHAYSGSLLANLVEELRPRAGSRGEAEALTLREAYKAGLSRSPR